jgi:hypothetical protein
MEQIGISLPRVQHCKEIKNKNMKQLFPLILFLLPCLAWAQYPSNGNQKITLGEQTTADGLIYRGVASTDTVRKPSIDTMAYMVLDTTTNIMWHYKKQTSNAWLRLNILPSDTASMLTNYWRAGRFSGFLPVANGGTGQTTLTANKVLVGSGTSGVLTPTNLHWDNTNSRLGIGQTPLYTLDVLESGASTVSNTFAMARITGSDNVANDLTLIGPANSQVRLNFGKSGIGATPDDGEMGYNLSTRSFRLVTAGVAAVTFDSLQRVGIKTTLPSEVLHVVGNGRFTAVGAGAYANDLNITSTGVLTTASSDEKYKYNILPINYGLNTILQLKPVNFQWIKGEEKDLGFIAQDVAEIIPEAVDTNWNSDLLFRYESLIPILTKAIQEQQALIKALEQRIINLENK